MTWFFRCVMKHLPIPVSDEDILEMLDVADSNNDGRISFEEFLPMVYPPAVVPEDQGRDNGAGTSERETERSETERFIVLRQT